MYMYKPAHEYIHLYSIANKASCIETAIKMQAVLDELYENKKIEGWETNYVDSFQKLEEKLIFIDYNKITKGQFPFLHLRVQINEDYFGKIDELIGENGFIQVFIS